MQAYDVIVVGAGPAGSSASLKLAQTGIRVLLIDRKKRPGTPKECAEGVGARIFDLIKMPIAEEWISNRFDSASVSFAASGKITFKTFNTKVYVLNRKVFDYDLAMQAQRAGAQLLFGTPVTDVSISRDGATVTTPAGSYTSKLLIAADGPQSQIAARLKMGNIKCGFGYQYELEGSTDLPHTLQIAFVSQVTGFDGYYWIFPKKDSLNVGIGSMRAFELKKRLDQFVLDSGLSSRRIIEQNAGLVPAQPHLADICADRLLIVGDAAGFTNPFTGGGIAAALYSGTLAADVAIAALRENRFDKRGLEMYARRWHDSPLSASWQAGLKLKALFDDPKRFRILSGVFAKFDSAIITSRKDLMSFIFKGLSFQELHLLYKASILFRKIIV